MVSPEPALLADKWQLEAAAQEVTFTKGLREQQKKPKQMFTNPRQTKLNKFSLRLLPPLQLFLLPSARQSWTWAFITARRIVLSKMKNIHWIGGYLAHKDGSPVHSRKC